MLRDKTARIWCLAATGMVRMTQPTDRRAVTAVEYAIIAGVLAAVIVLSVTAIGPELSTTFNRAAAPL